MKKMLYVLMALLITLSLVGCGDTQSGGTPTDKEYDVDLTQMSSTMVYSKVSDMMTSPGAYLGMQVKMSGNFSVYQDSTTGKIYYACLIADATACCSQGIEFVLSGNYTYPNDYPEINSSITVVGTFDAYVENGYTYCQLTDASFVK